MTITATQKYVRIAPRKLRLVADVVRGRQLADINEILSVLNKHGARVINETIRQAVANAVNNQGLTEQQLSLQSLVIDEGPTYKRFRAGARGRGKPILKRTSHVQVKLAVAQAEKPAQVEPKQPAKIEAAVPAPAKAVKKTTTTKKTVAKTKAKAQPKKKTQDK